MQYTLNLISQMDRVQTEGVENKTDPNAIKAQLAEIVNAVDIKHLAKDIYNFTCWTKPDGVEEDTPYNRCFANANPWLSFNDIGCNVYAPLLVELKVLSDAKTPADLPNWDNVSYILASGCGETFINLALQNVETLGREYAQIFLHGGIAADLEAYEKTFEDQYGTLEGVLKDFFEKIHAAGRVVYQVE